MAKKLTVKIAPTTYETKPSNCQLIWSHTPPAPEQCYSGLGQCWLVYIEVQRIRVNAWKLLQQFVTAVTLVLHTQVLILSGLEIKPGPLTQENLRSTTLELICGPVPTSAMLCLLTFSGWPSFGG